MSKWIKGFPPKIFGNYLLRYAVNRPADMITYRRMDYSPNDDRWYDRSGGKFFSAYVIGTGYEWWDEYGITETKTVKKIKIKI